MTPAILLSCVLFALGLGLIIKGGGIFVDAATWMAEASGIPQFVIGATIVSVATTLPELIVSLLAAARGYPSIAVGNAVGSVTANTGLILGLTIVFLPFAVRRGQLAVKGALMVLSVAVLMVLCRNDFLSLWEAVTVLLLFMAFIAENLHCAAKETSPERRLPVRKKDLGKNLVKFLLGAAALALGSHLLVEHGQTLAVDLFHVPVRIVAITLIAIGTSLPELVTAISALAKKQSSMSVGNIIGANIIDITVILPLCALLSGRGFAITDPDCVYLDMPVCLAETLLAVAPPLIGKRFYRWQGMVMLALYVSYLAFSIIV